MVTTAPSSRDRLLGAAMTLVRTKGYTATTVDDLCASTGLTKGAFFYHFKTKEDVFAAAAQRFGEEADSLFRRAAYMDKADPLQRLLGYVDFRIELLQGEIAEVTCVLGTLVQEVHMTHPGIREVCDRHITANAALVTELVVAAKRQYVPRARWSAEALGLYVQAVIQGALLLAKARQSIEPAIECLRVLRRHLELQFLSTPSKETAR
jgi:TetR/AcrR family transcriptional repressor of nem operon